MKKALVIGGVSIIGVALTAGVSLTVLHFLYKRVNVYQCQDLKKRIPVIFKVYGYGILEGGGHLEAAVYDPTSGGVFSYEVPIRDYSLVQKRYHYWPSRRSPDSEVYKDIIRLDADTGEFAINEGTMKPSFFGLCSVERAGQSSERSILLQSTYSTGQNNYPRYQLVFSPHLRADTFLVDTQKGRVWKAMKFPDIPGQPDVWDEMDVIDSAGEIGITPNEFVKLHAPPKKDEGNRN